MDLGAEKSRQLGRKIEARPDVSVIVVVYNMPREAPRTLYSLSADYQRQLNAQDYEVIVVDNGSEPPFDPKTLETLSGNFRLIRIEDAPPSPGRAINRGLAEARGDIIGVMIDGARIATPGLLHFARHGARLYEKALVATLNWHLGYDFQGWAIQSGYDESGEDALLESINWRKDGYRLFEIGTPDESSVDGWFQPLAESNALFTRKEVWAALGGVDERFNSPGGGLINLDTFCRALQLPDAELIILLAEATFHQVHGGTSSNAPPDRQIDNWLRWSAEYARILGRPYELLRTRRPPTYLGTLPRPALSRIVRAALHPSPMHPERPLGHNFNKQLWTDTAPAKPADQTVADLVALAENEFRHERFTAACAVARLIRTRAPDEPEPQRLLSLVAPWLRPDGPTPIRRLDYHLALAEAHRILGEKNASGTHYRSALAFQPPYSGPRIQYYFGERSSMHLPFAYELMRELKPGIFVQLGVGRGESYFTVCQSAADYDLETKCYGINSSDDEAGPLDPAILLEVENYNKRYSSFSTLKTMTFMEAAADFANDSIDLLHLGGTQGYEDAKRNFEAWLPKLSNTGIVLFNDVTPRSYGSGIWKLWNDICRPGASFVFDFGGSLGVWRKHTFSERDPALLRRLFGANSLERKRINDHQAVAASALALWHAREDNEGGEIADPLQISVFADQEGAREAPSMTKMLTGEGLQTIRFDQIENLGLRNRRGLRIGAGNCPAFVNFFRIKIARDRDDAVLFNAESAADFEQIKSSHGMLRHQENGTLLLVAVGSESAMTLPALELPANESCYLEVVLDATRARLDRKLAEIDGAAGDPETTLCLDVFHSVEEGYRQTECQSRYFPAGSWQFLTVEVPARKGDSGGPIRIDPATFPAVVDIAEITLKRPGTGETVWSARTQKEFDEFEISGTGSRLPHPKHLRILSFGGDPQLLLPSATNEMNDEPLRLEISIFVDPAPDTIRACMLTLNMRLRESSMKPEAPVEPEAPIDVVVPHLALSTNEGNGQCDGVSLHAPVRLDETQVVRFENIESLCRRPECRLRIQPLYAPVFLKISRIVITSDSDGLALYEAESAAEFDKIEASKGAVKQVMDRYFTVRASSPEQYFSLPALDLPLDRSCRLELALEPYGAPLIRAHSPQAPRATTEELRTQPDEAEPPPEVQIPTAKEEAPTIEHFSLNALEFRNSEEALEYALQNPREKAAASYHEAMIHGVALPLTPPSVK